MLNTIADAVGKIAQGVGAIFGIRHGTEEPRSRVEREVGDVEIRRYGPRIAAETTIGADEESARNQGFRLTGPLHIRRELQQRQDRDDGSRRPTAQREDRDDRAGRDPTHAIR